MFLSVATSKPLAAHLCLAAVLDLVAGPRGHCTLSCSSKHDGVINYGKALMKASRRCVTKLLQAMFRAEIELQHNLLDNPESGPDNQCIQPKPGQTRKQLAFTHRTCAACTVWKQQQQVLEAALGQFLRNLQGLLNRQTLESKSHQLLLVGRQAMGGAD